MDVLRTEVLDHVMDSFSFQDTRQVGQHGQLQLPVVTVHVDGCRASYALQSRQKNVNDLLLVMNILIEGLGHVAGLIRIGLNGTL